MSNLNLEYYDGNSLFVYPFLKNLDLETINLLKTTKNFEDLKDKISSDKLYFTCPERINTISCFEISKEDEVLEINACFGVVTQFLCDRAKHVTSVEFAKQNADILYERLKDRDNLDIIVGNISKVNFNKKFDYIILTDVLEFASFFFNSINPYREFIQFCKKLLKPNGTLILQIFNRFGLKNWLGQVDEHTLKKFDGLCDYPKFSLKSFTKKELSTLFKEIGFEYTQFYYPLPNHFHANHVLTSPLKHYGDLSLSIEYYEISREIIKRNELFDFADSFLIVAKNETPAEEFFYSAINYDCNTICYCNGKDKWAKKIPLDNKSKEYLLAMYDYYLNESERLKKLDDINISLVKCRKENDNLIFDWAEGESLSEILHKKYEINYADNYSVEYIKELINETKNIICKMYPDAIERDFNPKEIFPNFDEDLVIKNTKCVKNANIDFSQTNIFKNNNDYTIIDYELIFPFYIPLNFLIYRVIIRILELFSLDDLKLIIEELKIDKYEFDTYMKMVLFMEKYIPDVRDLVLKDKLKEE